MLAPVEFAISPRMRCRVWSVREKRPRRHASAASGTMSPTRDERRWSRRRGRRLRPVSGPDARRNRACRLGADRAAGRVVRVPSNPPKRLSTAAFPIAGMLPRDQRRSPWRLLIRVAALTVLLATAAALGAGRLDIQVPGAANEPVLVAPTATIPATSTATEVRTPRSPIEESAIAIGVGGPAAQVSAVDATAAVQAAATPDETPVPALAPTEPPFRRRIDPTPRAVPTATPQPTATAAPAATTGAASPYLLPGLPTSPWPPQGNRLDPGGGGRPRRTAGAGDRRRPAPPDLPHRPARGKPSSIRAAARFRRMGAPDCWRDE